MLNLATVLLGVDGGVRGRGRLFGSPGFTGSLPSGLRLLLQVEHLGRGEWGWKRGAGVSDSPKAGNAWESV